jgi:L-asparaginase
VPRSAGDDADRLVALLRFMLRGNRTVKVSTSRWQGFASPNYPNLGRIGEEIVIDPALLVPPPLEKTAFFASDIMEESVATIPIYPGMHADVLKKMLNLDVRGFILRTFGVENFRKTMISLTR